MMIKKAVSLLIAIAFAIGLVSGCGSNEPATPPAQTSDDAQSAGQIDVLVIGSTANIRSYGRSDLTYNIFSGTMTHLALAYVDENEMIQPLMADFSTDDNGKTWNFTINDDYKWHDGEPVKSSDVKFTAEYLNEKYSLSFYEKLEAINIIDDKNFQFVYKEPNIRAMYDGIISFRILPEHHFDHEHDYYEYHDPESAIGNGPYKLVDFNAETGILEFEAFADFPWGAPNVKTILFKLFSNEDAMYMALKNEEIDMIWSYGSGVSPTVLEDLEASGNIEFKPIYNTGNPFVLLFNYEKAPGNDVRFRKAVAHAIDYARFRELFGTPYVLPSRYGFIPSYAYAHVKTEEVYRNLDAARNLLAEMGAVDTDGDGILEIDGTTLALPLTTTSTYERVAELIVSNLREVGIDASFTLVDSATTFRTVTETERSYTATIQRFTAMGIGGSPGMASTYFDSRVFMMGYGNVTDPAYHAIVDGLQYASTTEEYEDYAKQCQEWYAENVPAISLLEDCYIMAYNKKISGLVVDGMFSTQNMQTWYSIQMD